MDFIEVTFVKVTQGGVVGPRAQRLLATRHIASVSAGILNTGHIVLSTGETLNVQETYGDLKKLLEADTSA
jgi:hypothetical protein